MLLNRKNVGFEILETIRAQYIEVKELKSELEKLQSTLNNLSAEYGKMLKNKENVEDLNKKITALNKNIFNIKTNLSAKEDMFNNNLMKIPNIPDENVPEGESEDDNVVVAIVLEKPTFDFVPKEHWELAEINQWIDFERATKISKSRFSVLKNDAALVERALINFMLDFNRSRGFEEISVPVIVNRGALEGTGQLPKFEDDLFKIDGEELFLIPTAEVPVTNLFQNEIIQENELPIMMTAYTPCFRKEAGAGGRDMRGIIRQHQFHKVELVAITKPEESDLMMDDMVNCASDLLKALGLPHRIVNLCTGDLGFSATNTKDIEVWLPGQGKYREISSISNTRDFQARRAKIRYKANGKNTFVNTLNGSSLAVGRTLVAIMENYQLADGNIGIPDVLKPYINSGVRT